MTVDHDGKIRMDPSSPYAMARLVGLKDRFRVAFANDPDSDRHGIVTRSAGLMNPNHYLAVADPLSAHASAPLACGRGGRQDAGQQQPDRSRRRKARPQALRGAGGLQVVRRRASSTARAASAARRAPARASCGTTAPSGRPTRTVRSWICWRRRSPPAPARIRVSTTGADGGVRQRRITRASTRRPRPQQKARLQQAVTGGREARNARRRADHRQADAGSRQQRPDRRTEDRDRERMVRGAAVGHREHLQDLRGELQRTSHLDALVTRGGSARQLGGWRSPMSDPLSPPFQTADSPCLDGPDNVKG